MSPAAPGGGSGYLDRLLPAIELLASSQCEPVEVAGALIADAVGHGGVVHTFGCGHSALVAAELSYRSGGLAAVNFLGLLPGRMGWIAATDAEEEPSRAVRLVEEGGVGAGDVVMLVSHSGRSPLILAVAREAQCRRASTIAVTAAASNLLGSLATAVLETGAPDSDCALRWDGASYGSMSSILGALLLNAAIAEAIARLLRAGVQVPILESVHAPGGRCQNAPITARLGRRIPCWSRMAVAGEGA